MTLSQRIIALAQAIAVDIYRLQRGTIAETRLYMGLTIPPGWIVCKGQLLAIADYPLLFAELGIVYGGDGVNSFGLPKLRSIGPLQRIIRASHADIAVVPVGLDVPAGIVCSAGSGGVLSFLVQLLEPVTVTAGPPKLSITIGANTYLLNRLTATATAWTYEHTVQAGDFGELTAAIDLNGATLSAAGVPVDLNSYYTPGTLLTMQSAAAVMTSAVDTAAITQICQLSAVGSSMTPTAATNTITI